MKRINLLLVFACLLSLPLRAGGDEPTFIQGYRDIRNFLFIFENGIPRQLEQQPVRSFKAKGDILAYANNANDLMVYHKGEKFKLGDMTATTYEVNQSFMYLQRDLLLSVFDGEKLTQLTFFLKDFAVSDSLIAFRDRNINILRVFARGQLHDLEVTLVGDLMEYKVGENTVAYINNTGFFKAYLNDNLYDIDNVAPEAYAPGGNIVAYVDGLYNYLKVFYKEKILVLEKIKPLSFQAGVDVVAYVSDETSFKVFSNGKLIKVEAFAPDFYLVRDRSVLFFMNNQFQLFLDGVRYPLDEFMPLNYQLSENNVAWKDNANRLMVFSEGKTSQVTLENVVAYELNGNTLKYELPDGTSRVWYKGKVYGNN